MSDAKLIADIKNAGGVVPALQAGVSAEGNGTVAEKFREIAKLWDMFAVYVKQFEDENSIGGL